MPKFTIGQLKAEFALKPSARSAAFKALLQQLRALARLFPPEEICAGISSGQIKLPRVKIPEGDPDRFSSDWASVQLASPEPPLTRTQYRRVLRGQDPLETGAPPATAEIDRVLLSFE
jgi:hypothetical protein